MKKLLYALVTVVLTGCTTVNQIHTYGTVESGVILDNHYHYKVWTGKKYYTVISDGLYQAGDRIKIK